MDKTVKVHTIENPWELLGMAQAEYEKMVDDMDAVYCHCDYLETHPNASAIYKPEGKSRLGVKKHGWLCPSCKKFVQIG